MSPELMSKKLNPAKRSGDLRAPRAHARATLEMDATLHLITDAVLCVCFGKSVGK